jgi:uncharacterized protein (UPF0303 family)
MQEQSFQGAANLGVAPQLAGATGILLISGLPEVDDHLLGVEILTEYLARKGEEL